MDSIPVSWNVYPSTAEYHAQRAAACGAEGTFTDDEWKALCDHYDNRCLSCRKKLPLTVDHVVPLSCGGSNYITNIQNLCGPCNYKKARRTIDYRPATETFTPLPFAPTPKSEPRPRKIKDVPGPCLRWPAYSVASNNAPYLNFVCEVIVQGDSEARRLKSEYKAQVSYYKEIRKQRMYLMGFEGPWWNDLDSDGVSAVCDLIRQRLGRE